MILTILSFFIFIYIVMRFIIPLPCSPKFKWIMGIGFLAVSQKFLIYRHIGSLLFAPDLPQYFLLTMEILYSFIFILTLLILIKDILRFVLWVSRAMGTSWRLPVPTLAINTSITLIAFGLGLLGVWQATKVPEVRTVELSVPHLPKELDGFSLVQLSDIHIGPLLKRDWLSEVVQRANQLKPSVVLITGDIIDGTSDKVRYELEPLSLLKAKYGVYGVTGNHEYYSNAKHWLPIFKDLGVNMLHNEHRVLSYQGAQLVIAGMPDQVERQFGGSGPDIKKTMQGAPKTTKILLVHRPGEVLTHHAADIQLSGHTHGGLMFFLKPIIAHYNEGFVEGLYDVNGLKLYVSPGTGLWNGFSCRIGVPAEITHIILRKKFY